MPRAPTYRGVAPARAAQPAGLVAHGGSAGRARVRAPEYGSCRRPWRAAVADPGRPGQAARDRAPARPFGGPRGRRRVEPRRTAAASLGLLETGPKGCIDRMTEKTF